MDDIIKRNQEEEDRKIKQCKIIADRIFRNFINIHEIYEISEKTSYLYEWRPHNMIYRENKYKSKLRFCQEEIDLLTSESFFTYSFQRSVENRLKLKYPHPLHNQGIFQTFIYNPLEDKPSGICIEKRTNNDPLSEQVLY